MAWLKGAGARSPRGFIRPPRATAAPSRVNAPITVDELKKQIASAGFAFRGYDSTNNGRGAEFVVHPVYGTIVNPVLESASGLRMADSKSHR